jgi:ABC-2 type transport system ATP-binding protein
VRRERKLAETVVVQTAALRKAYRSVDALRGLDLEVPAGSICGLLGQNGAGKTTTLKILLGMSRPTSGIARVFGLSPGDAREGVDIRSRVGFVSDEKHLLDSMKVGDLIAFTRRFYADWRGDLEERYRRSFDLPADREVGTLSRGMRTKLALLLALSRRVELLMLDEPTVHLDPAVTEEVLQVLVSHAAAEGTTVLFSTHQIAEVDQIADRVAIIHKGRTVVSGSLDEVRSRYQRVQMVFEADAPDASFRSEGIVRLHRSGRVMTVLTSAGSDAVIAEAQALRPHTTDLQPMTLKEIFLETVKGD